MEPMDWEDWERALDAQHDFADMEPLARVYTREPEELPYPPKFSFGLSTIYEEEEEGNTPPNTSTHRLASRDNKEAYGYVAPLKIQKQSVPKQESSPTLTMSSAAMGSASPSSLPRLPSPPPFPEVQIGPKSPGINAAPGAAMPENEDTSKLDNGAMRRIRPGTKAADMASGPPLVPLSELDSPFQLQEHLKALYHHHTHSSTNPKTTTPIDRPTALVIATPPQGVDRSLWLYELCRFLVQKANEVLVCFFNEDPPCSAQTCPEMRASEWQYLCAVHEPPKSCCAIDYCCHTLDWAAYTLTSQKQFPSRLTLGSEAAGGSQGGVRQLTNIMRRVYRIFAHAWFQHRGTFWQVEGDGGLYVFFKTVCDMYSLIPEENYTIPPEAEGLVTEEEDKPEGKSVLRKPDGDDKGDDEAAISTQATTRRHKPTPSLGSVVTTIQEGDEDDNKSPDNLVKEDQTAVLADAMKRSALHDAPLVSISRAAEKNEPGIASTETIEPSSTKANEPKAEIEQQEAEITTTEAPQEQLSKDEGLASKRAHSSDSVVTMINVNDDSNAITDEQTA